MLVRVFRQTATLLPVFLGLACSELVGIAVGLPDDSDTGYLGATTDEGTSSDASRDTGTGDRDTGTGVNRDTGSEWDTGTGRNTDTGTGNADTSVNPDGLIEVPIIHSSWFWISQSDNILNIQGSWYFFDDFDSSMNMTATDGSIVCVEGYVAHNHPEDYTSYFGAKIGFDLCADAPNSDGNKTAYPIANCSWSPGLQDRIKGLVFDIEGSPEFIPKEIRVQFIEDRLDSTYVVVSGQGERTVLMEDAALYYDPSAPPLNPDGVRSIMFYIHSSIGPVNFNFCINNLRILATPL